MSKFLDCTLVGLKKFIKMTPYFEDTIFSKNKIFVVYDWGHGKAYVRWDIDDKKRKIRFSIDYGIFCENAYVMQVSSFLTHLNEKNEEMKLILNSDGTVISKGSLSYRNAPLENNDFDELFSASLFFESFVDEIRKLSVGGFIYPHEIIKSKLEDDHSIFLADFDDDDELGEVETSSLFGGSINTPKLPESHDVDSILQRINERQESLRMQNENVPNENSELVHLINSSNKKDNDDKEDT